MTPAGRSLAEWAAAQNPVSLLVVRSLLIANALVCGAAGAICLLFVSRPAGDVAAALLWGVALAQLAVLPYTNPRRGETSRW